MLNYFGKSKYVLKKFLKSRTGYFLAIFRKKKKPLIFVIEEEFIFQKDDAGTQ